jgi:hypothetical protein
MASVNKVILIGNLGRDPETRYTTGGDAITNLNIATSEQWKDKSGEKQEKTEWHRVVLFGRQAEIAGEYLKKGRRSTSKAADAQGRGQRTASSGGDRNRRRPHALLGVAEAPGAATTSAAALAPERSRSRHAGAGGGAKSGGGAWLNPTTSAATSRSKARSSSVGSGGASGIYSPGRMGAKPNSRPTPEPIACGRPGAACHLVRCADLGAQRHGDHTPAEAHVAVVEREILPRRGRPLRRVEERACAAVFAQLDTAHRIGHPVSGLGAKAREHRIAGTRACNPVQILRVDVRPVEQGMLVSLHDDERVARAILVRDEPRQVATLLRPAIPPPLPTCSTRAPCRPPRLGLAPTPGQAASAGSRRR